MNLNMQKLAMQMDHATVAIVARYLALNKNNIVNAALFAERSNAPDRVTRILKAAVPAGSLAEPTSAGGIADLDTAASAFFTSLEPLSAFVRILGGGMRRIPIRVRTNLSSTPAMGYVVNEGEGKPMTPLVMARGVIERVKVVAMVAVTDDVLKSSSNTAQTFLTDELKRAAALAVDTAFLDRITTGAPSFASSGASALNAGEDLKALLVNVPAQSGSRFYFIAAPDVAADAATLQDTTGVFVFPNMGPDGGEMLNVPVIVSSGATAGTLTLVDAVGIGGDAETVGIETSNQASLELSDAPGVDSMTPSPAQLVSLWQVDTTAIKANIWFGAERVRDDAVAVLENISWGPSAGT